MELPLLFNRRSGVKSSHTANDAKRRLGPSTAAVTDALAAAPASARSVIEAGLCIVGDLESEGDVLVNGRVQGNITCKTLLVGPEASIAGGVVADEAVIRGKVEGVVRAGTILLEKTGTVEADLYHSRLAIEAGAVFEGTSRNCQEPKRLEAGKKGSEASGKSYVVELQAKAAHMLEELRANPAAESASAPLAARTARRKVNGRKPAPPPLPATTVDTAAESAPPAEELPLRTADGIAG
jgi:cytoskeletal protein CcmA (bactofilin family)